MHKDISIKNKVVLHIWCQRCGVSFSHDAISDFISELAKKK